MAELPSILDVAGAYGVEVNPATIARPEVRAKCPFCQADANQPRKYYLSINPDKNVFRCWFCGEAGGVIRFEALLSGQIESEVAERYGLLRRKHPAERLTARQLRLVGYVQRPEWERIRGRSEVYARRALETVLRQWNAFVRRQVEEARELLELARRTGEMEIAEEIIRARSQQVGVDLLTAAKSFINENERRKGAVR